ncbi:MAG TPA: FHA domain-containing protein [Candidatus Acidoferrum sp.]|nr:FHA domain-containing protein [Candidatus Acidoferrum sp.]
MGIILEVKSGPFAGQKVSLLTGHTLLVGRAAGRAQFAFPDDTFMSGVHFVVECAPQGCRVQDRKSSNGTFLNGARVHEAMLANGDEIKGGQTIFAVKIVADAKLDSLMPPQEVVPPAAPEQPPPAPKEQAKPSTPAGSPPAQILPPISEPPAKNVPQPMEAPPRFPAVPGQLGADAKPPRVSESPPGVASHIARKFGDGPLERGDGSPRGAAFSVMGWTFPEAPAEWQVQEGFGLQQSGHEEFPSSVAATEEFLGGITLQQFVESQISMLRGYLRDPKIEPIMPPRVGGADESMAVDVRHSTKDGRELVYRRIYARSGSSVGVLTVTTLAAEFPQVLQSLQPVLDGAAFRSTVNN